MKWSIILFWLVSARFLLAADTDNIAGRTALIERGRYLVENAGMCGDCHSPRDERGQFDRSRWLQGELIHFKPDHPMPFATVAPPIAGLPTFATDAAALKFLETGVNSAGKLAMPPMPQFRFNHEDAVAIVAYLRSLKK